MPWCPNCKAEYQEGFTECSDCKVALVDDIKEAEILVPFFQAEDKKIAEKLVKFYQYSNLNASCEYNKEIELYVVSIPPKKQMEAKKLYQAFYFVERERLLNGETDLIDDAEDKEQKEEGSDAYSDTASNDNSDIEEMGTDSDAEIAETEANDNKNSDYDQDTPSDEVTAFDEEAAEEPSVYVMKEDQYKDLAGTVGVFLFFGVAGIIFVILNLTGIISFLNGWIPTTVMSILFLSFLFVAITTQQKAKKVRAEIAIENKLTAEINDWLTQNITEAFLSSLHKEDISEELNYIKKTDTIKEMLLTEFGPQNLAYLDRLIEEYYTKTFGY